MDYGFLTLNEGSLVIPAACMALVIATLASYLVAKFTGRWVIANLLKTLNGGVSRRSRPITGPEWQWPNGQLTERFMNGRAKSAEWQKYGPVYRIWAGSNPEIVITTPEHLRIFHSDSARHGKTLDANFGWYFSHFLGRCVGLLVGEEWTSMRRLLEPAFRHSATVTRMPVIDREARKFMTSLPSLGKSDTSGDGAETFTLHAITAFMKFPFFLSAEVIYGELSASENDALWGLATRRLALTPNIFRGGLYRSSLLRWYDPPLYRELMAFVRDWKQFNLEIAENRTQQGLSVPVASYWKSYTEGKITVEQMTHSLDEMLFANLDVSTFVITWLITLVADSSEAKRELRDEIAAHSDNFTEYLARSDTHLHRCLYESMRLRPITIFNVGETSPAVKNFGGILVKPNTMVVVDTLAINTRNPFWGPNSESFDPSRFKNIKKADLRYNLALFGFGHRKCLGQHFASPMVKAVAAHLFQQYDVQVYDGRRGNNDYKIDEKAWVPMADVVLQLTRYK